MFLLLVRKEGYMLHWARRACLSVVYAGDIVHAACDEEDAIGRPGQVVYLRAHGPAHVLDPPCLLVLEAVLAEGGAVRLVLGGDPEEDVAVIAGRCQCLACSR